ncbi:hypothetical protein RintRC_6738 [Richelia intracellularis]|nr:hypothetical protein RintRC_6738 [Richelia intracellularis]
MLIVAKVIAHFDSLATFISLHSQVSHFLSTLGQKETALDKCGMN